MSYSESLPRKIMDMGSSLGKILGTILTNARLILTVAHIGPSGKLSGVRSEAWGSCKWDYT